ncbi:hypothetical protein GI584_14235 [Gracilibacillus salitolerans]|uniref:Uncharacterized protein n=1 Tax=Gracilibacillus salitolerans TaxID=2663022 RepID=A0A5Q2TLV3_9BACI|nr:hypothetical protein [Gracilibacillus salitolerans]QGH35131.1 hypothetical protein GI584_14235 [Gracilibacillus salitolerans]
MTFKEAYTSLKQLYKKLMFPENRYAHKWTLAEIDQLDVHFFEELMCTEKYEPEVYLSDVW